MQTPTVYIVLLAVAILLVIGAARGFAQVKADSEQKMTEVVLIQHIGNDHQFNLNYTVAHIAALLDTVRPDAIGLYDDPEWVKVGCLYQASNPAAHAVSNYAREQSIPLYGLGLTAEPFSETQKSIKNYQDKFPDEESIRNGARMSLDRETARFSRELRNPPSLEDLFNRIFPLKNSSVSQQARSRIEATARRIVTGIDSLIQKKHHRRFVLVLDPVLADCVGAELKKRKQVVLVSTSSYLPLKPEALERRMDFMHTAWILSGLLDEWFGMWAPQCFPTERIAGLTARLDSLAPAHPVTRFFRARWLMQNRDFTGAKPILEALVALKEEVLFPFPINGKWIRPPWSSVRAKAQLNLAFVYDYAGEREKALSLYKELLAKGDTLDLEARAAGYVYDDIHWVIESYTRKAFTGTPEEAFRHFRFKVKFPECAPPQPNTR